jgi:hypothetical protein
LLNYGQSLRATRTIEMWTMLTLFAMQLITFCFTFILKHHCGFRRVATRRCGIRRCGMLRAPKFLQRTLQRRIVPFCYIVIHTFLFSRVVASGILRITFYMMYNEVSSTPCSLCFPFGLHFQAILSDLLGAYAASNTLEQGILYGGLNCT